MLLHAEPLYATGKFCAACGLRVRSMSFVFYLCSLLFARCCSLFLIRMMMLKMMMLKVMVVVVMVMVVVLVLFLLVVMMIARSIFLDSLVMKASGGLPLAAASC